MSPARLLVAVFLGGCAGGAARDLLDGTARSILLLNLVGCMLLGLLAVAAPHHWRPLLGTGFCGAFTTFGTVMVLAEQDLEDGRALASIGYLSASLLGGVAAAALGIAAGHVLTRRQDLAPEDPDVEVD